MSRIVIKFGGTSVGTTEKIINAARIIKKRYLENNEIIVIVSAMEGVTDELIKKSELISKDFNKFEYDVLLSSGEQISSALLSGALSSLGLKSRSWLSWQIPILTEGQHSNSKIIEIETKNVIEFIKDRGVPIIAGFQGISKDGRLTTIGRGGSDASAVAVAKFFNADSCEIYTDVDGVYTTDPSINIKARKIEKISYEEMLEMASLGAKVMQPIAVQTAMINNLPIQVRSTFSEKEGTMIVSGEDAETTKTVTGIAFSKNDAKITIMGVVDRPGVAASIFEPLGKNSINVDMVIQNISPDGKETDITFTIKRGDLNKTMNLLKNEELKVEYKKIIHDDKVSKVSVVGAGMISNPGVTHKMFRALANESVNILAISTSEIKISVLINENDVKKSVQTLHKVFGLE